MKVAKCPNCGTIIEDDPCWRQRGYFHLYTDFCKADELIVWNKPLLEKIKASNIVFKWGKCFVRFYSDGVHNYGLRDDGTIVRIAKIHCRNPNSQDVNALREPPKEKRTIPSSSTQQSIKTFISP